MIRLIENGVYFISRETILEVREDGNLSFIRGGEKAEYMPVDITRLERNEARKIQ